MEGYFSPIKTEVKWPGPVTFQEDDPKKGYVSIFLDIPEFATKGISIFKGKKPSNVEVECKFLSTEVDVEVRVHTETTITKYMYTKSTPEDIDPNKSRYKIRNGKLELQLKKVGPVTWTIYRRHFMEKPANFNQNNNYNDITGDFSIHKDTATTTITTTTPSTPISTITTTTLTTTSI